MKRVIDFFAKLKYLITPNYWISFSSSLDNQTKLEGNNKLFAKSNVKGSYLGFGTYVGINSFLPKSKIGKFSAIGPNVKLVRGNHPAHKFISIHPAFYSTRKQAGFTFVNENKFEEFKGNRYSIEIGNDVWIGSDVIILEGVKIGDGAIIGTGSVVSKDIEPYSINVGNSIKTIGYRFEPEQINELLKLQWWNMELDDIKKHIKEFEDINNINLLKTK